MRNPPGPGALFAVLLLCLSTVPASAGQTTWTPGSVPPSLVLALGDGTIKKTFPLASGTSQLDLTVRLFLADSANLVFTWKTDGQTWVRQAKKMPGESSTERVTLPPGRLITLEISTPEGTSLASIKLRRN